MTVEMGIVLAVVAIALVMFATQKVPLYVTALGILVVLVLVPFAGRLPWIRELPLDLAGAFPTVAEGLSGLSSPATVTVLAMFILSAGIQRSGLLHVAGRRLMPFIGTSEIRLMVVVLVLVGAVSGFINNTAAVAVAIPFVLEICRSMGANPSKVLMPLSFVGMLGGMLTVIGTSTSILGTSVLAASPAFGRQLGMFEFAPIGLLVLVVGLAYLLTVGRLLLPDRGAQDTTEDGDEQFVVELRIPSSSEWAGETVADTELATTIGVQVRRILRGGERIGDDEPLAAGDVLVVRGTVRQIADAIAHEDVDVATSLYGAPDGDTVLVRAILRNRLAFGGKRAGSIGFASRFRARLVGIETTGIRAARLADERLSVGEIVLLSVAEENLPRLRRHPDLVLLSEFEDEVDARRMWLVGLTMVGVVALAALTPLPIVVTALLGVVVLAATGCVTTEDVTSGVPWDIIFLLAGVIPLGIAMTKSGTAQWIGDGLASLTAGWHPLVVLIALYVVTTLLTEVVSNNASVVILIPVAIAMSQALGIPLIALAVTVMFAASTSFLSPVGYQTNAMVFGTGVYRFTDFARVGAPLNALLSVVTSTAIWWMWVR